MRRVTGLFGIIAVLFGLWSGPFFHIHTEEDSSHGHDHAAFLHAHFFEPVSEDHSLQSEIEDGRDRHHGTSVTVLAANNRKSLVFIAEIESSARIVEPPISIGHGMDMPVHAHDPPARRNSNPRSPPA
jgi:hypothetical protein